MKTTLSSVVRDPKFEEWRIHYHIPLHSPPTALFGTTTDHLLGALDVLGRDPQCCSHLEMETYTWEVLPPELKKRDVGSSTSSSGADAPAVIPRRCESPSQSQSISAARCTRRDFAQP